MLDPDMQREILRGIMAGYRENIPEFAANEFDGPNRMIFMRMQDLWSRKEPIDRVTVANELMLRNELEECGGLTYLVKLSDGDAE